jgi:hypothetical protein
MPRVCTICGSPKRKQIEIEVLKNRPIREIAQRFGVTHDSLGRHTKNCISTQIKLAKEHVAVNFAELLISDLEEARKSLRSIELKATKGRQYNAAVLAIEKRIEVTLTGCEFQKPSESASRKSGVTHRFALTIEETKEFYGISPGQVSENSTNSELDTEDSQVQ